MNKNLSKISLAFLFVVALIGTFLRSPYVADIPLNYTNLVHAHSHSHTAFQGWIYLILFLLLTSIFIAKDKIKKGHYVLQFKLTVLIVVGILVSFSMQGYGLHSIIFSTLFQVLNYWFIYRFLKDSGPVTSFYSLAFYKNRSMARCIVHHHAFRHWISFGERAKRY